MNTEKMLPDNPILEFSLRILHPLSSLFLSPRQHAMSEMLEIEKEEGNTNIVSYCLLHNCDEDSSYEL